MSAAGLIRSMAIPLSLVLWSPLLSAAPSSTKPIVLDDVGKAQALALLRERAEQYVALQEREIAAVGALPSEATPEQIAAFEARLAERMRLVRKDAKQGDIFVPQVEALLRQIVAEEMKGRDDAPARKTIGEGNPRQDAEPDARPVKVAVNGAYTDTPVTTTPPSLLLRLPVLPESLAYRFVGRHLTLRDGKSGLIADYLLNVGPPLPADAHTHEEAK